MKRLSGLRLHKPACLSPRVWLSLLLFGCIIVYLALLGLPETPKKISTQIANDLDLRIGYLWFRDKNDKLPLQVHKVWGLLGGEPILKGKYKEMNEQEFSKNPLLPHIVWDFPRCTELMKQFGDPKVIKMFNSYPEPVMKADLIRNVILYMEGGIYQDMDVLPAKPWADIIAIADSRLGTSAGVILFLDSPPNLTADRLCPKEKKDSWLTRVAFDTYIAARNHPFVMDIINVQKERYDEMMAFRSSGGQWSTYCDVCFYSGPDTITTAYNRNKHKYNDIYVFSYEDTFRYVDFGKAHGWFKTKRNVDE